jgi:catechol 2,3-dioxygenase-like lactoylglutathione lyase family enzyme
MISHLSLGVADLERSTRFYDAALGALGYVRVWTNAHRAGYGVEGGNDKLALFPCSDAAPPGDGFHVAFDAGSSEAVDRFHAAALAAGGTCNGPPGLRVRYSPTYYAAFVIDLDGHRLEAVCQ